MDYGKILRNLYLVYYKREPDKEGYEYWSVRLKRDSLKRVLSDFISSQEAVSLYGERKVMRLKNLIEGRHTSDGLILIVVKILVYWRSFRELIDKSSFILKATLGRALTAITGRIPSINLFERRVYSQNGEDGVIEEIFRKIGFTEKFCVELGTGDGRECNCRYVIEKYGLDYLLIDGGDYSNPVLDIKREFLTAENINEIFTKYQVPEEFDLLSIDIDYNTFWIWHALDRKYKPRVVVVEYNSTIKPNESKAVRYEPHGVWTGDNYFGASLLAFVKLGRIKGYTLVGCESRGVNAFFVRDDLAKRHFIIRKYEKLYRKPSFVYPLSEREFIDY